MQETPRRRSDSTLGQVRARLLARYGGKLGKGREAQMRGMIDARREAFQIDLARDDEFALAGIESPEDLRDRFIPNFFFGCEADDPTNALAFRPELWPLGVSPKAIFSSDIGHWDVEEMNEVLAEAWELVENGLLDEDDFRRFTFGNAVDLMAGANPDFFEGTAIEEDVAKLQASRSTSL